MTSVQMWRVSKGSWCQRRQSMYQDRLFRIVGTSSKYLADVFLRLTSARSAQHSAQTTSGAQRAARHSSRGEQHSCCIATLTCRMFCLSASEDVAPIAQQEPLLTKQSMSPAESGRKNENRLGNHIRAEKQGLHAPVLRDVLRTDTQACQHRGQTQAFEKGADIQRQNAQFTSSAHLVASCGAVVCAVHVAPAAHSSKASTVTEEPCFHPEGLAQHRLLPKQLLPAHQSQAGGSSAALM